MPLIAHPKSIPIRTIHIEQLQLNALVPPPRSGGGGCVGGGGGGGGEMTDKA